MSVFSDACAIGCTKMHFVEYLKNVQFRFLRTSMALTSSKLFA